MKIENEKQRKQNIEMFYKEKRDCKEKIKEEESKIKE